MGKEGGAGGADTHRWRTPARGRGPSGTGRFEIVRKPSNYGWPTCYKRDLAYYEWNFHEFAPGTTTGGDPYFFFFLPFFFLSFFLAFLSFFLPLFLAIAASLLEGRAPVACCDPAPTRGWSER